MEGRDHQTARLFAPQGLRHTLLHLARRLIGKGNGGDLACGVATHPDQMSDLIGDHSRLTGSGTGEDQTGACNIFDGLLLTGI